MRLAPTGLRGRLALLYGTLLFLTGTLVVGVTYFFTVRAINAKFKATFPTPQSPSGAPVTVPDQTYFGPTVDIEHQLDISRQEILNQLLQISALTIIIVGLLTVALGYLIAGRMLRPLQSVTATARRLSESNLHERIALTGPHDEVRDLADTFDGMLDRLHRAFDSQSRFIANASHELRTPVTMARTAIEVVLARPATPPEAVALGRKLLIANERQARLINGLLTLARSERELQTHSLADVSVVAGRAVDPLTPEAHRAGVTVETALRPGEVSGDAVLLERAVVNLVENAIKYNVPAGRIWISSGRHEGRSFITVENTGPPVAAEDAEAIFEPFRRLSGTRVRSDHGAGLGLSIVRAVMQAHGGTVESLPRPDGGLVITLSLPASRS